MPHNDLLIDMGFHNAASPSSAPSTASPATVEGRDASLLDQQLAELGLGDLDYSTPSQSV